MNEKTRRVAIVVAVILGLAALLYLGGLLGQLMSNYNVWLSAGGMMGKNNIDYTQYDLDSVIAYFMEVGDNINARIKEKTE